MASSGWGREEKTLHMEAASGLTPRGIMTRAMARPSGTLCTASAIATKRPRSLCASPLKETPMPTWGGRWV